ncbi:hypothetical protein BDW22DRAFT_1359333 [Trametopsis cervina]|nr:hypothetical protein BDW22DRAFT_1359333 [Trametopsis cervina]
MAIGTFRLTGKAKSGQDGAAYIVGCIGRAYVGSHNFTPSASGTLSGSDFNPALESGSAFPLRNETDLFTAEG